MGRRGTERLLPAAKAGRVLASGDELREADQETRTFAPAGIGWGCLRRLGSAERVEVGPCEPVVSAL